MNKEMFEEKILDYLEGMLSESDRNAFEAALQNPDCKAQLEGYRRLMKIEKFIAQREVDISAALHTRVMAHLKYQPHQSSFVVVWRYFMKFASIQRASAAALVTICVVAVVLEISKNQSLKDLEYEGTQQSTVATSQNALQMKRVVSQEQIALTGGMLAKSPLNNNTDAEKNDVNGVSIQKDESRLDRPTRQFMPIQPEVLGFSKGKGSLNEEVGKAVSPTQNARSGHNALEDLSSSKKSFPLIVDKLSASKENDVKIFRDETSLRYTPPNAEQYDTYAENQRFQTSIEAVSTFSIDVDSASYSNTRRYLLQGTLPPPESIRIEEFINYFDYDYPKQSEKPFSLNYEIAPSPLEPDRFLLKVGIRAKDMKDSDSPWNLVFLVDVSGSMDESDKLPLVKRSLGILAKNMRPADRVAIVTYAGDAGLALDSTPGSQREKILDAIENLKAGGSTYGSAGINLAYDIVQKYRVDGGVNRVVLATDGDFNVGVTSEADLLKLIEEKRKSGTTLTTLGFGSGNLQDGKMEQLADRGNGNYFYIDSIREARKVLETQLVSTMEVVAKDVKLQIEFNPDQVSQYRLIGYDNRRLNKEDFNNDLIDAGEIGSGHTVTAFYEVVLKDSPLAKKLAVESRYQIPVSTQALETPKEVAHELAFLKIRYKEPNGNESKLLEFPIEKSAVKMNASEATRDFRFAAAVSAFGTLLRKSVFVGNYTFKDIIKLADESRGEDKFGYRQDLIELVKDAETAK